MIEARIANLKKTLTRISGIPVVLSRIDTQKIMLQCRRYEEKGFHRILRKQKEGVPNRA